jgi:hypothetical protein
MSQIRFMHMLNNLDPGQVYNEKDPNFPGYFPLNDTKGMEEHVNALPEEIRKLFDPVTFPEQ